MAFLAAPWRRRLGRLSGEMRRCCGEPAKELLSLRA